MAFAGFNFRVEKCSQTENRYCSEQTMFFYLFWISVVINFIIFARLVCVCVCACVCVCVCFMKTPNTSVVYYAFYVIIQYRKNEADSSVRKCEQIKISKICNIHGNVQKRTKINRIVNGYSWNYTNVCVCVCVCVCEYLYVLVHLTLSSINIPRSKALPCPPYLFVCIRVRHQTVRFVQSLPLSELVRRRSVAAELSGFWMLTSSDSLKPEA